MSGTGKIIVKEMSWEGGRCQVGSGRHKPVCRGGMPLPVRPQAHTNSRVRVPVARTCNRAYLNVTASP